jgi:hypothetical protein
VVWPAVLPQLRWLSRQLDGGQIDKVVAVAGEGFRFRGADSLQVDRALRDVLEFPDFLPPVTHGRLVEGEVWLRREHTQGDYRWTILGGDGRAIGELTLPRAFTPLVFRRGELWGVETNEVDVPWVVRYRIVRQ